MNAHEPSHAVHGILPPHILEAIRRRGNPAERERAEATLEHDVSLRAERRATAPARRRPRGKRPPRLLGVATTHREIHDAHHTAGLPGALVRAEGDPAGSDVDVTRVYDGFGATWDLYHDVFGRDSYDDAGATLIGTVHYRTGYDNAFWNGTQMVFGDGDGTLFTSFTASVDIMGHELTHAVTEVESGLEYHDQPGALNESLSDVFGSLVKQRAASPQQTADQADWLIGAGILGPTIHGVALRSMKAPGTAYDDPVLGKDPQPAHMDHYDPTSDDNGGVHINSGIPNHAFYLFAVALGGYAWEQAGNVWYAAAVDDTLPSDASFKQFAQLTVHHAYELYGYDVARACRRAWKKVGVKVPRPTEEVAAHEAVPAPRTGASSDTPTPV